MSGDSNAVFWFGLSCGDETDVKMGQSGLPKEVELSLLFQPGHDGFAETLGKALESLGVKPVYYGLGVDGFIRVGLAIGEASHVVYGTPLVVKSLDVGPDWVERLTKAAEIVDWPKDFRTPNWQIAALM